MTRALVFLSIVLVAVPAHARFGKRSESTSEDSDSDSSNTHKARPAPPQSSSSESSEHDARPAPPRRSEPDHDPVPVRHGPRHHGWGHDGYHYGWGFGYYPYFWAPRPVPGDDLLEPEAPALTGTVGLTGQLHNQGGAILAVEAAVEGERWGANLTLMGIFVAAEDDSGELDTLKILDLHATFALLNGQHGRLRLELGIDTVFAPDLTVLGPDAGISGALALVGPLGLEGSAHYSPWPHQRVEGFLGLTLGFGRVGLRLGWRHLWLDDRALLPGEPRNTDTFTGPLLGLSLAI